MFGKKNPAEPKKRRIGIHETTLENDMRYRGPLNFQHFQILGWLCIAASQVLVILKLGGRLDAQLAIDSAGALGILQTVVGFALPFLLIANFAQILDASNGYRMQLIKNIAATAAVCGLFYLFFYRYLVGGFEALLEDPAQALPAVQSVLNEVAEYGFLDFNIFVDLLLCTLVMLFLNFRPRRVFVGRWVILFRLFALLPIAYEVCCMAFKIQAAQGLIRIPVWAYPLLTVKPPMTFVLFVVLAIFVKTRELRFLKHGKTHEEYQAFLKTRRNSWGFSVFLAIMMVVVSLVDFSVVIGFTIGEGISSFMTSIETAQVAVDGESADVTDGDAIAASAGNAIATPNEGAIAAPNDDAIPAPNDDAAAAQSGNEAASSPGDFDLEASANSYFKSDEGSAAMEKGALIAFAVGFGGSMYLAFLAPLMLLFSYTRQPKFWLIGLLIPVVGVCLILLIYFEGTHRLLFHLPIQKVNLQELKEYAVLFTAMLE